MEYSTLVSVQILDTGIAIGASLLFSLLSDVT